MKQLEHPVIKDRAHKHDKQRSFKNFNTHPTNRAPGQPWLPAPGPTDRSY